MKTGLFPGSFDPFTKGHEDIVKQSLNLFDKIIIAISKNSTKNNFFSLEKRIEKINLLYKKNNRISVNYYEGLTIDFCKKENINFLIRGIRNEIDFTYEKDIANANRELDNNIETIFFISSPSYSHISSKIVREIIKNNGDISKFVSYSI
ncbi:pantetheine-phosphate adenylyltransferase [Bacteroidota bacterium]|nr:pantetheine-phosphate adenylyltransferase [Bacteroidota bacterium]